MLRGLYTAATGMSTQRSKMDVVTNNIVNAQTAGFKKDSVVSSTFGSVMLAEMTDTGVINTASEVGPYSFGTHVDRAVTDFSQGSIEETGEQSDLALLGDGFFAVETPAGERYTRAGDFTVDRDGYLVTEDGAYVLGQNGRINVGQGDFTVDAMGNVGTADDGTETLRVVSFADTGVLRKQGDNLYFAYGGAQPEAAADYQITQGARETSNVDIASEMVDMLTVYRAYEANSKILTMTDETLGRAVNDLGSLR